MIKRTLRIALILATVFANHPAIGFAAAPSAGAEQSGGLGHDAHGPHFELMSIDGFAALWSIVVFLAVLIVLRVVAWKPIANVLAEREKFIAESLASAKHDRDEAKMMLERYSAQIQKAKEDATAIVEEGRRDADVLKRKIEEQARSEAAGMIDRAKREIEIARDTAIKELYTLSTRLATDAASRIIRRELQISPADQERLISESIEQLGSINRN